MIAKEALLSYPDFNKEFHVFRNASDYQLGTVIMQNDKPLAFYTRKMNQAQQKYTTGKQELLSIVKTLKSFKNILLGQRIVVHYLNLLYKKLASNRLVRWCMLLKEYGPTFVHVKGEKNVVADALSRLDMEACPKDTISQEESNKELSYVTTEDIEWEEFPMLPKLISKE